MVSGFFDSLRFSARPQEPAVFSLGYRIREGERTTGFRSGFVTTDGKENPRFTEHDAYFLLTLEREQGVGSFATCEEVSAVDDEPGGQRFEATSRTRTREHGFVLAEEEGQLRVVEAGPGAAVSSVRTAVNDHGDET